MKYRIFPAVFLLFTIRSFAGSQDIFQYDKDHIAMELLSLEQLENYVSMHPGITPQLVKEAGFPLDGNLILNGEKGKPVTSGVDNTVLGIPSFLWGCILGVTGVLIVYLVTEDKYETGKAAKGLFTSILCSAVLIVAFYAVFIIWMGGAYYYY